MMAAEEDDGTGQGLEWRAGISVGLGLGWLMTILFWYTMWSEGFADSQKLAIILLSLLVVAGITVSVWIPWSTLRGTDKERAIWGLRGFGTRVAVTVAVLVVLTLLAVYWLFFEAVDYTLCQSFLVVIVVMGAMVAMLALMWMRWGVRGQQVAVAAQSMQDAAMARKDQDEEDDSR
jgi:signal transduction histidine kinase